MPGRIASARSDNVNNAQDRSPNVSSVCIPNTRPIVSWTMEEVMGPVAKHRREAGSIRSGSSAFSSVTPRTGTPSSAALPSCQSANSAYFGSVSLPRNVITSRLFATSLGNTNWPRLPIVVPSKVTTEGGPKIPRFSSDMKLRSNPSTPPKTLTMSPGSESIAVS